MRAYKRTSWTTVCKHIVTTDYANTTCSNRQFIDGHIHIVYHSTDFLALNIFVACVAPFPLCHTFAAVVVVVIVFVGRQYLNAHTVRCWSRAHLGVWLANIREESSYCLLFIASLKCLYRNNSLIVVWKLFLASSPQNNNDNWSHIVYTNSKSNPSYYYCDACENIPYPFGLPEESQSTPNPRWVEAECYNGYSNNNDTNHF